MTESIQLTLHRQTLAIDPALGVHGLVEALALHTRSAADDAQDGSLAVVSIGVDGQPARLFCTSNVDALLALRPAAVLVDLALVAQYVRFAVNGLEVTTQVSQALGAMLRTMPVVSCEAQVTELQQRLQLMTLLLDGFALQRHHRALAETAQHLHAVTRSLLDAARHGDNAGCLDVLRYELPPVLSAAAHALSGSTANR